MPSVFRPSLRSLVAPLVAGLFVLVSSGCGNRGPAPSEAERVSPARQTAFRVRLDADAGLNADQGWAAPLNQPVTLPVEADGRIGDPVQVTERSVVQSAVDSDQTAADAVAIGASVHVLFVEAGTGRLYHTRSADDGRTWTPATLQVDSVDVQWVRGQPISGGAAPPRAYGYVYDAGSNGGSGKNWYGEVPVDR